MVNDMDNFWEWFEQQEELNMCDCTSKVKRTPHKHAAIIKAWADGAQIELFLGGSWQEASYPKWGTGMQYRIKPEPATDLAQYGVEVGDVWVTEKGTRFVVTRMFARSEGQVLLETRGLGADAGIRMDYSALRKGALEHDTLLFRRGVINRLSEV